MSHTSYLPVWRRLEQWRGEPGNRNRNGNIAFLMNQRQILVTRGVVEARKLMEENLMRFEGSFQESQIHPSYELLRQLKETLTRHIALHCIGILTQLKMTK